MQKLSSSERAKKWRLENPERAEAIQDRYLRNNPEKRKESSNGYWQREREKNPDRWKAEMKEKAKNHRLNHLDEYKKMEKEKSRLRRENNLDAVQEYNKKYNRVRRLASYGLDEEKYQQMVLSQSGKCALCNQDENKFHIDHCHNIGTVRGLLCGGCNMMLGLIEKRISLSNDFLDKIARYLKH